MTFVDHVIPFFSGLACVLLSLASLWHVKARNSPVLILMAWLFLANFVIMINAFIWWSNIAISGAIWCDISAKLQPAWGMGIPCANLCLARRLEAIASTRAVSVPSEKRRRTLYIELFISIGLPIIYSALSCVYQGHRYDIIEGVGCNPSAVVTTPYFVLGVAPPLAAFFINLGYSTLCIRHFLLRQKQFTAVLSSSGSNLNKNRYIRMLALCFVEILVNLPTQIAIQILAIPAYRDNFGPYLSWDYVHYGFDAVIRYDSTAFEANGGKRTFIEQTLARWVAPISALFCFFFFGLNKDATDEYKMAWRHCCNSFSKFAGKGSVRNKPSPQGIPTQPSHELPRLGMQETSDSMYFDEYSKSSPQSPSAVFAKQQDGRHFDDIAIHVERHTF